MRIVKFSTAEDTYECIITNVLQDKLSVDAIKELYAKIWGIEIFFREMKYAIGLARFYAKYELYNAGNMVKNDTLQFL